MIEKKIKELCRVHDIDRLFILTDSTVDGLTSDILPGIPRLVVPAGEGSKSLKGAEEVWRFLMENNALRRSALINIGGGMICDLGGFAASTFKRGIPHINVPTTLLAAVDAAIGGKTGINFGGLKNEIGTFAFPLGVFPLLRLLRSLPESEWLSGAGEALKTGLLEGEELFALASSREFLAERQPDVVEEVIRRCAAFKDSIVKEDLREKGRRRILNLGHTWGHALESLMLERGTPVPHGIAVAYGLLETLNRSLSRQENPKRKEELKALRSRYADVLAAWFPPFEITEEDRGKLSELMKYDKKNTTTETINWVYLEGIGSPI